MNSHSIPEILGEPSARNVASVLWRPASISLRTRPANSGSACSITLHDGMAEKHIQARKSDTPDQSPWKSLPSKSASVNSLGSTRTNQFPELSRMSASTP